MNLAIRRATYQDIDVCTRINYEITGGLIENPLFRVYWCDGYAPAYTYELARLNPL